MRYFNESLSINMNNNEISGNNSKLDSKNKISLRDLLKVTLTELSDEIDSYNKKNKPISDITEVITIDETKKFINKDNITYTSIKLLMFNKEERDKEYIRYNISAIRSIINKLNRLIEKYYGKLVIEFIEPNKKGYITLKLTIKKTLLEGCSNKKSKKDKDVIDEKVSIKLDEYIENQLEYMKNEEEKFCNEFINTCFNEESDGLEDKYKLDSEKRRKNFANGNSKEEKLKDEANAIQKLYKAVYGLSDEDFINGNFIPIMGKAFGRLMGMISITFAGNRIAKHKLDKNKYLKNTKKPKAIVLMAITAFVGLSTLVVNKALKTNMRNVQRERLKNFYENKLAYIDSRIEKSDSEEEKYELRKLRSKLVRDSERVKIFANNAYKSND